MRKEGRCLVGDDIRKKLCGLNLIKSFRSLAFTPN